jgi:hypothetical protein
MAQRMQLAQMQAAQEQANAAERLRYGYDSLSQARELALADDAARKEQQQMAVQQSAAKLLQDQAEMDALSQYRANQMKMDEGKLALDREKAYLPSVHWNNETGQVDQFDPRTNAVNTLRAGGQMPNSMVTTATRGKLEQQESDLLGAYDIAKRLKEKLDDPGPVAGAAGALRRGLNTVGGVFGLDDSNPADDAAVLANQFNARIIKALRSDSNIAEKERLRLENALPKPDEWTQGVGKVRARLAEHLQTSLNSVRDNAAKRGAPIPKPFMSKDEVFDAFKAGQITKDDVVQWKSNNIWDLLGELTAKPF